MNKLLLKLILLFLSLNITAQNAKYVLLISIDGLRPEFYLSNEWNTPVLKELKSNGIYAEGVNTVFPSITYPSHTTLITGQYPAKHGIFYNVPVNDSIGHWNYEAKAIQVETLWDATKKAGLTSGAVMWPVTVGAPITYNFPVRRPDNLEKKEFNNLTITDRYVTPKSLIHDMLENKVITKDPKQLEFYELDLTIGKIAGYIIDKYHPNLTAVHFVGCDHASHEYGINSVETHETVKVIDKEIGKLISALEKDGIKDQTTIIVTGDHGFLDSNTAFYPNVILKELGLIKEGSWTAKFRSAGGSAFLYLKDQALLPIILKRFSQLSAADKKLFRIVDRKELDKVGADPEAAMALAMSSGVVAEGSEKGNLLTKSTKAGGNHGYYPTMKGMQTGFIIAGAGIKKPSSIKIMESREIAPLIAKILNIPFGVKSKIGEKILTKVKAD